MSWLGIAVFEGFIEDSVNKIREENPNRVVNSIDLLLEIVKEDKSPIIIDLLNNSGVSKDYFIYRLEEFNSDYCEPKDYSKLQTEEEPKFASVSKTLSHYLDDTLMYAKLLGKSLATSNDFVWVFLSTPPLAFIQYLESYNMLTVIETGRYLHELKSTERFIKAVKKDNSF